MEFSHTGTEETFRDNSVKPERPWLAPLAGFSDLPFRLLCREYGCTTACTEMVSVKGLVYGGQNTYELIRSVDWDRPLVVQLFGEDPSFFREAAHRLLQQGISYFDLNAGCSVKKVFKGGAGAALLADPQRMFRILEEMVRVAGEGRVGVKLRSGIQTDEFVSGPSVVELDHLGLGWVALHPRSAKQGFSGEASWSHLKRLKERIGVPLLASGDLFTAEDALSCLNRTGVDGLMFARGALDRPFIFHEFLQSLQTGQAGPEEKRKEQSRRLAAARRHVQLSREYGDPDRSFLKMRTILPRYLRGFPLVRKFRSRIVRASDWEEIESLLAELESCVSVCEADIEQGRN